MIRGEAATALRFLRCDNVGQVILVPIRDDRGKFSVYVPILTKCLLEASVDAVPQGDLSELERDVELLAESRVSYVHSKREISIGRR